MHLSPRVWPAERHQLAAAAMQCQPRVCQAQEAGGHSGPPCSLARQSEATPAKPMGASGDAQRHHGKAPRLRKLVRSGRTLVTHRLCHCAPHRPSERRARANASGYCVTGDLGDISVCCWVPRPWDSCLECEGIGFEITLGGCHSLTTCGEVVA